MRSTIAFHGRRLDIDRDIMLRKFFIGFAGAIAVGLLVLYALSIWIFGRRQRPAMVNPREGQVVSLSHARSMRL